MGLSKRRAAEVLRMFWLLLGECGAAARGFAATGYGAPSPGHYGLGACLLTEVLMTFLSGWPSRRSNSSPAHP
jgi:hypothetical protein